MDGVGIDPSIAGTSAPGAQQLDFQNRDPPDTATGQSLSGPFALGCLFVFPTQVYRHFSLYTAVYRQKTFLKNQLFLFFLFSKSFVEI